VPAPKDRPPSIPYISGDTFRFFADFAYDELDTSLNPSAVQRGNTIFVATHYLGTFFQNIHPHIAHPYILISHNSDDPAPGVYAAHLESPKILAWFAQNWDGFAHPKIHPLPIGLANAHWPHGKIETLAHVRAQKYKKRYLAYLNIAINTYPQERQRVFDLFSQKSFCFHPRPRKHKKFLQDIASSHFVICPRGNGLDTHRLWESLLLGSIPIVKTSSLDPLYKDLPILIVSDWEEVTEDFLIRAASQYSQKKFSQDPLWIDYWLQKIRQCAQDSV
jgi:hypothetical protein